MRFYVAVEDVEGSVRIKKLFSKEKKEKEQKQREEPSSERLWF